MSTIENKPPILHILVVGFHHKLGCQVEFSYPPLIPGTAGKNECPSGWKYLSTLALPDGSHNFSEDTVFFNLPSLLDPTESVYGVSCYRQIPVEKLKIRTADVTRSTVQKSVCILARLPIYGYIEVKLSLIADAFFDQGDFSSTNLLIKVYHQLNDCLLDDDSHRPLRHFYVGLSLREIVLNWRHKMLMLFKLFLLQRRVICFGSPVRGMCVVILGVASLIPRLLEKGFQEVACVRTSRPLSPMPDFTDTIQRETAEIRQTTEQQKYEQRQKQKQHQQQHQQQQQQQHQQQHQQKNIQNEKEEAAERLAASEVVVVQAQEPKQQQQQQNNITMMEAHKKPKNNCINSINDAINEEVVVVVDATSLSTVGSLENIDNTNNDLLDKQIERKSSLARESSIDTLVSSLSTLSSINPDEYRAPISIFASGNLCLPYLSLPYMDLLTDPSVLSYVIGTSNVLFQQKRQLADVLIDIENANFDTHDQELRRQLILSTEDLRFMDYIIKHVQSPKENAEGSEYWIREQFQGYILALLRASVTTDTTVKDIDHFNAHFVQAFKRTQCYQEWYDVRPSAEFFELLPVGHPFSGTLSVADMKLKITQTMQNSESGRKINQAVNTTSRAVGGAISHAKGAFSNWWSSITTQPQISTAVGNNIENNVEIITQTQEMSVTFQNRKDPDEIEVGVSINLDDNVQRKFLKIIDDVSGGDGVGIVGVGVGSCSSSSGGSEKLIDSAEELHEEDEEVEDDNNSETIGDILQKNKPPSDAEEAENSLMELTKQQKQQKQIGVVEIGKEAEILDENYTKAQQQQQQQQQLANATTPFNSNNKDHSNGEIFIV